MNNQLKQTLIWTPRILGLLFILFVSLFAFDVFEENLGLWGTILALFMHLLPSLVMLVALILAWYQHWEWAGAIGYIGFAIWYTSFAFGRGLEVVTLLILAGIPTLVGILFLVDWIYRKQLVS